MSPDRSPNDVRARTPFPVTVRQATLAEIVGLRHAELRPGLPRESAAFDGDDDPTTWHFGAFAGVGGENVGCATFMSRPWQGSPAFQLRGMATRADLARRGIGTKLLGFAERCLVGRTGSALFWCNARTSAVEFYRRLGWQVVSAEFDIPTVGPHQAMLRRPKEPA
jgi:GNAT superfamily N-acetyltransferase